MKIPRLIRRSLISCIYLFIVIFTTGPVAWAFLNSFRSSEDIISNPYTIIPENLTLSGFYKLVYSTDYVIYFANSSLVAFLVMSLAVPIAFIATASVRYGSSIVQRTSIALSGWTYMIPPVVLVFSQYLLFQPIGLVDSRVGLVFAQLPLCYSLSFWLILPFVDDFPRDLEDSLLLDGAKLLDLLVVVYRWSRSALLAAAAFSFIVSWNQFITARILVSGNKKTIPVGLQDIYRSTVVDWSMLMAGSVLTLVPVVIGVIFIQRMMRQRSRIGGVWG